MNIAKGIVLKIIVIRQFFSSHDPFIAREKSHSRFSGNSPFDHPAIGLARVVDKAGDRTTRCINDRVLIENHQIEALQFILSIGRLRESSYTPHYPGICFSFYLHIRLV